MAWLIDEAVPARAAEESAPPCLACSSWFRTLGMPGSVRDAAAVVGALAGMEGDGGDGGEGVFALDEGEVCGVIAGVDADVAAVVEAWDVKAMLPDWLAAEGGDAPSLVNMMLPSLPCEVAPMRAMRPPPARREGRRAAGHAGAWAEVEHTAGWGRAWTWAPGVQGRERCHHVMG